MEKVQTLSQEERSELIKFIGEAVLTNTVFPSFRPGVNSITIQELIHSRNVDTIRELGKSIKKKANDFDEDFSSKENFKIGVFEASKVISALKLIIRNIEFENHRKTVEAEIRSMEKELESLETPEERKLKLISKLEALKA